MADGAFLVRYLGTRVPYDEGMSQMRQAMADIDVCGPQLLLLEHEDIITITRQHGRKHLLTSDDALMSDGIRIVETDRGGDITFHGAGQLVGYPIIKLPPSVGPLDYVRSLESALLRVCAQLGVHNTICIPGKTGIWVQSDATSHPKKLIAVGVGISRGVTRHGFAFNMSIDLERFTRHIVPCGLVGYGVTSLEREISSLPDFGDIRHCVARELRLEISAKTGCQNFKIEE